MAVNEAYLAHIVDHMSEFGEFEVKKMFGGVGFFRDKHMFGMIGGGIFRLKVDDFNREDYLAHGMEPMYSKDKKSSLPYYEVPEEVIANKALLREWILKAYEAALRAKKK